MPILKGKSSPLIRETFGLPDEPTPASSDLSSLRVLNVAPPGWGKTELGMSCPDSLLLAFQEGHKMTPGYKIIIDAWDGKLANGELEPYKDSEGVIHSSFRKVLASLQKTDKFKVVILDTVDDMVKLMLDFKLRKAGVEHIAQMGEFGVGYDIGQNTPFRQALSGIIKSGRGIYATTHEQINTHTFKVGNKTRKETTLPKGIYTQIFSQFDIIFHGIYGKRIKGSKRRQRLIQTEGSEDILAKNRYGIFPPAFIVPEKFEERWKQISGFLTDPKKREQAFAQYEKAGYTLD